MPAADIKEAVAFCNNLGIRHEIIKTDPFSIPKIAANTPERCYLCKKLVFSAFLHDLGLSCVRVRVHSGAGYLMARIEIMPSEMPFLLEKRAEIYAQFKKTGFSYTSLDIAGYRTGSLNEVLRDVN